MVFQFCIKWVRMAYSHQDMRLDFSLSNLVVGSTAGVVHLSSRLFTICERDTSYFFLCNKLYFKLLVIVRGSKKPVLR